MINNNLRSLLLLSAATLFSPVHAVGIAIEDVEMGDVEREERGTETVTFPHVKLSFKREKFFEDCYQDDDAPLMSLPTQEGKQDDEACWKLLFALKNHYKIHDKNKYIHTYHIMAKFLLSKNIYPKHENTDAKKKVFLTQIIDTIGQGILPTVENKKLKKWSYIYEAMLLKHWAQHYSAHPEKRLRDAYDQLKKAMNLKTTRTTYFLAAELILENGYVPQGMTETDAQELAREYISHGLEKQEVALGRKNPSPPQNKEDFITKHARPPYLKDLQNLPSIRNNSPAFCEELPAVELDPLADFDYATLSLTQGSGDLPLRDQVQNKVGELQEQYVIEGNTFKRQNVSGRGLRCFFNAAGLESQDVVAALKGLTANPLVRYMIANEIVSALATPDQISGAVKIAIDYDAYEQENTRLNALQVKRNELLAAQNASGREADINTLDAIYHHLDAQYEANRENLRQRALSLVTFQAFIENQIEKENMMVFLPDVQENRLGNLTSIDAIAYAANIGVKIFTPHGGDLRLSHQYIPEGATEMKYLYHSDLHFQALEKVEDLMDEEGDKGLEKVDDLLDKDEEMVDCSGNSSEDSGDGIVPSDEALKKLYPNVVTFYNGYYFDVSIVRKTLYLRKQKNYLHEEIGKYLDLDARKISDILISNGVRTCTPVSSEVKEIVLSTIVKYLSDIEGGRLKQGEFGKEIIAQLQSSGSHKPVELSYIYHGVNNVKKYKKKPLSESDYNKVMQLYRQGSSIVDICNKYKSLNMYQVTASLIAGLDKNEIRNAYVVSVDASSLSTAEKKDLIIEAFKRLKAQNSGKNVPITHIVKALKKHKIGFKMIKRILTEEGLIQAELKSKHLSVELAEKIRQAYQKRTARGEKGGALKKALAKDFSVTLIQVNTLLYKKRQSYVSDTGRGLKIQKRREAVIAAFHTLTPEQQKKPTKFIREIFENKGGDIPADSSIRNTLVKAELYVVKERRTQAPKQTGKRKRGDDKGPGTPQDKRRRLDD